MSKSSTSKVSPNSTAGRWLPVFLWAGLIFTLSSLAQISVPQLFAWDFFIKKIAHLLEFAILFALIFRATSGKWLVSFAATMLYAVSDEFHQSFVPGRTATIYDLGFDLSGANIAAYIIWKLQAVRQKKPKK